MPQGQPIKFSRPIRLSRLIKVSGLGGPPQGYDKLLHLNTTIRGLDESGMGKSWLVGGCAGLRMIATRCFADGSEVDHARLWGQSRTGSVDHPIERNVRAAAHHDRRRVVAKEMSDGFIRHVVGDGLHWIHRGTVHQQEVLLAVDDMVANLRQLGELAQDRLSQLVSHRDEPLEPATLEVVSRSQSRRVDGGERAIPNALHAQRVELRQAPPGLERARPRKTNVTCHQNPTIPPSFCSR